MEERCIFCKICHGKEQQTMIVHERDDFVVFRDIRPASDQHYLVCPKQHIKNVKQLNSSHVELIEKLVTIGDEALQKQGADSEDVIRGFHWPPFTSINHLHLHVISSTNQMGWMSRTIFRLNSWWFVSVEWVLERLRNRPLSSDGS